MKKLFIAEKPSVAAEFASALGVTAKRRNGFIEDEHYIFTWCVGHLVTMSYPAAYDSRYLRWDLDTLPFLPAVFRYELIESVKAQYDIVRSQLLRQDVESIYICTDSGREGEYIYRLVDEMAGVRDKKRLRVWIDSQTRDEILRGIREAKDWTEYDNLAASAYLRAKEDYLMGINFSRLLTLKYGQAIGQVLKKEKTVLSVGRVMTCVLGMVVRREREIRNFVKTPFYKVILQVKQGDFSLSAEYKALEGSCYFGAPCLYKDNGFRDKEKALAFVEDLKGACREGAEARLAAIEKKKELKHPPLLYNLAELQNDCSRIFKISPDECLKIVQDLYEAKLLTYPRTDARVLSTAVAKEIVNNIRGLEKLPDYARVCEYILQEDKYKKILKSKYVNDKMITDHYAIIPTGQGLSFLSGAKALHQSVYQLVCRRFLSIFLPPAEYQKYSLDIGVAGEHFFAGFKVCKQEGYLYLYRRQEEKKEENAEEDVDNPAFIAMLQSLRKNALFAVEDFVLREGESSPPKRYSSGSMILAMENAGQLIEDEELRGVIKGSGIGTSATRAEILKKLVHISYLQLNDKTQIISPSLFGELVYEAVFISIRQLLNPDLSASWEKGLSYVAEGSISSQEYMQKLESFVRLRTENVKQLYNQGLLRQAYEQLKEFYTEADSKKKKPKRGRKS